MHARFRVVFRKRYARAVSDFFAVFADFQRADVLACDCIEIETLVFRKQHFRRGQIGEIHLFPLNLKRFSCGSQRGICLGFFHVGFGEIFAYRRGLFGKRLAFGVKITIFYFAGFRRSGKL